jgi:DNA repair exonuclease SbcCD ATPase subunit
VLSAIEIKGYQSLASARIELGLITAVTGRSNSGKTAVLRALELLAHNDRGVSYITTGKAACSVTTADDAEGWVARITRERKGGGEYRVKFDEIPAPAVYTKLQGGVPAEVSGLLRLTELNVATQFAAPYLLSESGRTIAATLGRLTGVSIVLAAAQEAGRRRKAIARDLKGADARLSALTGQLQQFAGLGAQLTAICRAETALAVVEAGAARIDGLRAAVTRVEDEEELVASLREVVDRHEPPSLERTEALYARLTEVRRLVAGIEGAQEAAKDALRRVTAAERAERKAHEAIHAALVAAGQCPMCGQDVAA